MTSLLKKPKFEDIVDSIDTPFKIKKRDRQAKIIIESPQLANLEEDTEEQEKRRIQEQVRHAEIKRVAQESGAPASFLRALRGRPSYNIDNSESDAQVARAIQLGLDQASIQADNAISVANEVANTVVVTRNMLRRAGPVQELLF